MKLSPSEQEAIVQLLSRIYFDILAIESEHQLRVGEGDFRPRIEYFHDAVRALSSGNPSHRRQGERLDVEWLTYDLNCLRYIHAMPLAPFKPHAHPLSPKTDLIKPEPGAVTTTHRRPDRATRERLVELYKNYALLFAALLKPAADTDYHERVDALHHDVKDINALVEQFDHGKLDDAINTIQHLEDDDLRQELLDFLHGQKQKKSEELKKLLAALKKAAKQKDEEIVVVEKAHMEYGLAQLAIYESTKDILKKMAKQGLNLAGRFVEEAMRETRREMGR